MRLGQLARKLSVRPVEIVHFLAKHNIQIEEDANTKIADDHINMVLREYGHPEETQIIEPKLEDRVEPETEPVLPEPEISQEAPTSEISGPEKVELIKAPKIELSGLKVLGKIELPETKKKETPVEPAPEATPEGTVKPRTDFRKSLDTRRSRPQAPRRNPIAAQREREEREKAERRKEELEREKERRAIHYMKKVKPTPPTRRVRMVDEPVEEFTQEALVEAPKTWWGRFMRWLNT